MTAHDAAMEVTEGCHGAGVSERLVAVGENAKPPHWNMERFGFS